MITTIRNRTRPFRAVISALFTRIVFTLHCIVAFWRIYRSGYWNDLYYALFGGIGLLLVETIVTIKIRKGAEYKWFCPSVFFYLLTIVPCVWIMEMGLLSDRYSTPVCGDVNVTSAAATTANNETVLLLNSTQTSHNITYLEELRRGLQGQAEQFEKIVGLASHQWIVMVEQILLFILILGRWMLPKGDISRDELSQLLLVYIGMAADIIEFFEAFKEEKVKCNRELIIVILGIWSASLLQFTLVLTASKARKSRAGFSDKQDGSRTAACMESCGDCCASCCGTEVFGIMTTVVLQDGPFLLLRILLLVKYEVVSYMHYFFTVKNTLVLLLMVYRLIIVCQTKSGSSQNQREDASRYGLSRYTCYNVICSIMITKKNGDSEKNNAEKISLEATA